jgi:hypothetical protein
MVAIAVSHARKSVCDSATAPCVNPANAAIVQHAAAMIASRRGEPTWARHALAIPRRGRIPQSSLPIATIATSMASKGQRVSSTSSLWIFWTVLKPISGSNRPKAMRPVHPASRSARTTSRRGEGAASAI